ncbi:hypothetical protein EON83_26430 [bacterium]|nr:MAG: hypothetical protein EON83_26430 [bacterium]
MTEQKAEAWVLRLTRIWSPGQRDVLAITPESRMIMIRITPKVKLQIWVDDEDSPDSITLWETRWRTRLWCDMNNGVAAITPQFSGGMSEKDEELATQFVSEWMPAFRRGCWLSGCPIEATADEKAEWMQGFTREEIEAWNLKM